MKKHSLKSFSFIMTFLMFFVISAMPVYALTTPKVDKNAQTQGSITINKEGAVFEAYKILDADKSIYNYDYTVNDKFKNFFDNSNYGSYKKDAIKDLNKDDIKDFAVNIHKFILDNNIEGQKLENGKKNTVDLGYYIVLETSGDSKGAFVASTPMLVAVPTALENSWNYDVEINPKDNTATLEKRIVMEDNRRVKTSCASIGDTIKYEVKASIPSYEKNAKNIVYKFTDKMGKGLTYNDKLGFKVTSGSKTFESGKDYTVESKSDENGTTITINFVYDNIKDYAQSGLCLNYEAKLNEKAIINDINKIGNENNIELEYTNNPYVEGSTKKLKDKVTSYTFGLQIEKIDEATKGEKNKLYLKGAEFSLAPVINGKIVEENKHSYVTDEKGIITILGLKEGEYELREEEAPEGYSLLKDPIKIKIEASKDSEGNFTGEASFKIINNNKAATELEEVKSDENTLFNIEVLNRKGVSLPSTGGLGNTGFIKIAITLLGVVCILAAAGIIYNRVELKRNK